jgi:hypothetical protein
MQEETAVVLSIFIESYLYVKRRSLFINFTRISQALFLSVVAPIVSLPDL